MIMHENQLINDRVTWLLTFQGLLLAALGFAWERKVGGLLRFSACLALESQLSRRRAS
jgi:hypothetical protein